MKRRDFLKQTGTGALAAGIPAGVGAGVQSSKPEIKKYNILYLHSHDTGRMIQPYGYPVPTPNLQRLAMEGLLFRSYFTTHPTCSASRASLLTGTYPHSNGMIGLAHRGFSLKDKDMHLVRYLGINGYHTALAGIQHEVSHKEGEPWKVLGYHESLGGHETAHTKAAEWLEQKRDKPFFLSVGFVETHRKFSQPGYVVRPAYTLPAEIMPDVPETREDMAAFIQSAKILDEKMGTVLAALERSGQMNNTIVLCTTDHGIAFPEMKCNLYDKGTGIMLIMKIPGIEGGKTVDSLLSVIDVFPTLCELVGIDTPAWTQGVSFLDILTGKKPEVREYVLSQMNYHAAYEPLRALRTKRYKYIRRYGNKTTPVLPNCDDGLSKTFWLEHGWKDKELAREELYDLYFDPHEKNNLAKDPEHNETREKMMQLLEAEMKKTGDPMLNGYIDAPITAVLNDPDGVSPNEKTYSVGRKEKK